MENCRCQCCAIIDKNSLVVMGGWGWDGVLHSSIEALDFKTSKWTNHPWMKEARRAFTAKLYKEDGALFDVFYCCTQYRHI